jgi:translation initiation factor IF-3
MNVRPPGGRFDRRRPEAGLRINNRIRVPEVRVIAEEEQLGVMPTHEALRLAEEKGLDLVEISPRAFPPVCRIMDYGKFKYERDVRQKEARKKQSRTGLKEIKFRPKIDPHDYATKKGHVERFLKGGSKVKITIMFRGREMAHTDLGRKILDRLVADLGEKVVVESMPKQEGRNMIMVVSPSKKFLEQLAKDRERGAETEAPEPEAEAPAEAEPVADEAPAEVPAGIEATADAAPEAEAVEVAAAENEG